MTRNPKLRQVARTVLLVGEGDAEVQFMQHLKGLYVQRGSGIVVTIKNARGKGAAHVVDFAFRQSRNAAYDMKATLLDTDADWNDKTREQLQIPPATPGEVLRFLMDQHRLKQEDLSDCAPQGRISDILGGKRAISKEIAKRLAQRFNVRADLFLG